MPGRIGSIIDKNAFRRTVDGVIDARSYTRLFQMLQSTQEILYLQIQIYSANVSRSSGINRFP